MDTKDSTNKIYTFSSLSLREIKGKSQNRIFWLSVKCGSAYLVCVCFGFFGQTEAWCGVGVSFPAEGLQPKLFQVVWDLRMTEGPSCVFFYWTHSMGKLFCPLWWPALRRADFWQQFVETWLDLLVDNKGEKSECTGVTFIQQ